MSHHSEIKLKARKADPVTYRLESMDVAMRVCVHELTSALASYATRSDVPLFGAEKQFEDAATIMAAMLKEGEKCPLKENH